MEGSVGIKKEVVLPMVLKAPVTKRFREKNRYPPLAEERPNPV
jgi:hypothetical protein